MPDRYRSPQSDFLARKEDEQISCAKQSDPEMGSKENQSLTAQSAVEWDALPTNDKTKRNALFELHAQKAKAAHDRGVSLADIYRNFEKLGMTVSVATFRKMWREKFPE